MCSERNVIGLTGSMPSDAHCAGVGAKRAIRLAWLDTSVSGGAGDLGAAPVLRHQHNDDRSHGQDGHDDHRLRMAQPRARPLETKNMLKPQTSSLRRGDFVACIADMPVANS